MTSNGTASTNFSGFATPLDPIYAKYHGVGFSPSLVLAFTPTFFIGMFGLLMNSSLIYVTIKCGSTLNKLFNTLIMVDSLWACFFDASYVIRFLIPLLGINYIPANICFYIQWPASFFSAQLITMLFIACERLLCLLFPIWFAKRRSSWNRMYINILVGLSLCQVTLINTLIYIGIQNEFREKDIMCNLGDYSGQLVQKVAHFINSYLEYAIIGMYAIIWLLVLKRTIMHDQIGSKQNVHLLKSISAIMAIVIVGWIYNGAFGPVWQPFIVLNREDFFLYSIYAYVNLIIAANSINAILLYFMSSDYRKSYQQVFLFLRSGQTTPVHPISIVTHHRDHGIQSK